MGNHNGQHITRSSNLAVLGPKATVQTCSLLNLFAVSVQKAHFLPFVARFSHESPLNSDSGGNLATNSSIWRLAQSYQPSWLATIVYTLVGIFIELVMK